MIRALTALILAVVPLPAFAWSNQGHMATGLIAYDALSRDDPGTVAAIIAIIAHHPDRARFERNVAGLRGPVRERALFGWMARWPDDIRETSYSRPKWHYYAQISTGATWLTFRVGRANEAFDGTLAIVRDSKASAAAKAIALCWLFHITGDMHQPLHAGHRLSWRFPFTDRLGTIAWVKRNAKAAPIELHQLWDHALDRPMDDASGANALVRTIESINLTPAQTAIDGRGDFDRWFLESHALAARVAYAPAALEAARWASAAPVLPQSYIARMDRLARVRVAQAGQRLGNLMRFALSSSR